MENKHKQHHVWRHYLNGWANERGQVWCQMDNSPFQTSTENVGHRRDFYALKELSEVDLRCVEEVVIQRATVPHLQEINRGWIPLFMRVFEARRVWVDTGRRNAELEKALDIAINTLEENAHATMEGNAVPLLASLRAGDAAFIRGSTEQAVHFCQFFALQVMRTPGIMKRALPLLQEFGKHPRWAGFNAEASWGLLRWIFANNIGFSLFGRRQSMRITFMDTPETAEFVTGDQPIINTRAFGREEGSEVTATTWYYPLSSRIAVSFTMDEDNGITERLAVSDMQIATYNHMIAQASERQIYAASERSLTNLPRNARHSYR
jgi:hypothetical protein